MVLRRNSIRRIGGVAALLLTLTSAAVAGSPDVKDQAPLRARDARLAAAGVLNVPDLNGCVKWCLEDRNPCDPPVFKTTDGRCQEP